MVSENREKKLTARIKELEAERDALSSRLKKIEDNRNHPLGNELCLDSLISLIPDIFWLKSPEGRYLYCNLSFEDFSGLPREQLLGKSDYDIVDKDLADFFRKKDLQALGNGGPCKNEELLTFAADGKSRLMETIKPPLYGDKGDAIGILGIGRDITELREARLRLESFMNTSPDLFIAFDSRGIAVEVSHSMTVLLRKNSEAAKAGSVQGLHFETLFTCFIDNEPFCRYNEFLNSPEPRQREATFFHRESEKWFRIQMISMGTGFAMVGTDITELHRVQEEIVTSEDRWRSFLDSTENIMGVIDKDSRLASVNRKALEYLPGNDSLKQIQGKTVEELAEIIITGRPAMLEAYRKVRETGEPIIVEDFFELPAKAIWLKCRLFKAGDGVGFIIEDITEMKTLEAQILQMQKIESVGRLAGGIAHDFNNILDIIIGYTDLALASGNSRGETEKYLNEIKKAGMKSTSLVSHLLAFARKQAIKPEVVDLNRAISGMLTMLGNLMKKKVTLDWKPGNPLKPVRIDPLQIDQILANLCVNSRDAIEKSGHISITTSMAEFSREDASLSPEVRPGEYVRLTVADDGAGMNEKTLSLIFEPFFTTKEVGQGTGLGLSTVYGIIKQNGGFIQVQSRPGEGTTVNLYFPPHREEQEVFP